MFKIIGAVGAALVISALSTSVSFAASDRFEGLYAGNCKGAQCYVEIVKKKGKQYTLIYTARDRKNYDKILCKSVIPMNRGVLRFTRSYNVKDGLDGVDKNKKHAYVAPSIEGMFTLYTQATCGKYEMMGEYIPFGD